MEGAGGLSLLRDGVVMLGAAIACVLLFRRLGLGATLGYLLAGVLIGPFALGLVGGAEAKLGFAEIGITLLLFIVGLELHPRRLWRLRKDIFGLGLLQVVLCGAAVSAVVYYGTQFSTAAALVLGLPLALSSTAQVLPMLRSAGRMNTPFGERTFSILLLQDLSIVPLITITAALSRAPADPSTPPGWLMALYTVGAVAGLVLAGRFILNPLFRLIGGLGEREMFVAAGLFTVLASAAVMQSLHLSTALGAFVAGMMLADSPYRHELEADIEPFRSILLGLFFLAVGMMLDLPAIVAHPLLVGGIAAALIGVKTLIIFALGRLFGMDNRQALSLGLLLSQGGEFGFVLFQQAQSAMLIEPQAASLFGAIVTISMATTPFLMEIARRFRTADEERSDLDGPEYAERNNAIVVGYGRFGQTVAQMLTLKKVPVTLIDLEPELIDTVHQFGSKVYYGDGTRVDLLRQAGAEEAEAILFCHAGEQITREQLEGMREAFPNACVFVRAFDRRHVMAIHGVEVAGTVRELFESAVCMGRKALESLGAADEEIGRVEAEYRRRDAERLMRQSLSGDLLSGREVLITPKGRGEA